MAKFNWHLLVLLIFSIHPRPSWSSKINVTIPILAPLMNRDADRFGYGVASMYAIDLINKRNDILKDYHLVPKIYDTVVSRIISLWLSIRFFIALGKQWI